MPADNEWIEKKVARMLKDLRASGFFDSGIEEAISLQKVHGYAWDVALKISCNYWCSYALTESLQSN
jgi:hypothetical protein